MILHARHPPAHRDAIDVHVHRRQEHADLLPVARRRGLPGRRAGHHDAAVGRREHRRRRRVVHAIGVAKEEQQEPGKDEQRHTDDGSREKPDRAVITAAPRTKGQPAGSIRIRVVSGSVAGRGQKVETGSNFRHSQPKLNPVSQARSGGSEVGLGVLERHLLHLILEG